LLQDLLFALALLAVGLLFVLDPLFALGPLFVLDPLFALGPLVALGLIPVFV
jgi:hypothetical protein